MALALLPTMKEADTGAADNQKFSRLKQRAKMAACHQKAT
ncbi:hypothetical protein SGGMMB4_04940 [Sodalis glossinidius str. 'morsitans']|uniref:Uncharacterized protein n=1 Tax=Sodalis glossinidius (strain morsitans) TaxID=343509 RepID=A0A193QMN7_SODGM|nr:hypothetical protein SGGMMB4_04940 [Sodalis glossinidius str. 'morsitans']